MTSYLTIVADIGTITLAIAAIIGGILAYKNINILRDQYRHNTFLSLMDDLSSESARKNREIINMCMKPDANGQYPAKIPIHEVWSLMTWGIGQQIGSVDVINSIEETVGCLDKVGFFLLRGDTKLKDEAPIWIWEITYEMWGKLSNYVKTKQLSHYAFAKYFEELFNEGLIKRRYSFNPQP